MTSRGKQFEVLSIDDICSLPAPEFLIDGILPLDALACLYGPTNLGKSFVALDMCLSVASGIDWQGQQVRQGPVLYVAAEGARGYGKRIDAWCEYRGIDRPQPFHGIRVPVQLMDPEHVIGIQCCIEQMEEPPLLVVLDTFSRCLVGANENSQEDITVAVEAMACIKSVCGATLMAVHHTGRNGEYERGSTVLPGALDSSSLLSSKDGVLTLSCTKQKDFEYFEPIGIKLIPSSGSLVVTRVGLDPLRAMEPFYWEVLARISNMMEGSGSGYTFLQSMSGCSEATFRRKMAEFRQIGVVHKDDGQRGLYRITEKGKELLALHSDRMSNGEQP
jgi:predicted transcriptional regulator